MMTCRMLLYALHTAYCFTFFFTSTLLDATLQTSTLLNALLTALLTAGEFDIMTCRDLGNGEVQYFRIRYD